MLKDVTEKGEIPYFLYHYLRKEYLSLYGMTFSNLPVEE